MKGLYKLISGFRERGRNLRNAPTAVAPARYVIHKASRAPDPVGGSYSGRTWDTARLRALYQPFYRDAADARAIAKALNASNPVGFMVSEVT